MASFYELKAQLATLDLRIEAALAAEKAAAIREIQARVAEFRISPEDLQRTLHPHVRKATRRSQIAGERGSR